jgi:hypothetical protein
MTASDSPTIARRYARLRGLPVTALFLGLDHYGGRYLDGDWSVAPTFAAYLDETARRLATK